MTCREFQRLLLIDPRSADPGFRRHAASCPECASRHREALRFEAKLERTLRTGPVTKTTAPRRPAPAGLWWRLLALIVALALLAWASGLPGG